MALEYIYPVTYTEENNYTFIRKMELTIFDCSQFSLDTVCENSLWSYQKCGSDSNYCNPFIDGDKIYLQLPIEPNKYSAIFFQILNSETDEEITGIITAQYGRDERGIYYSNGIIDTTSGALPDCWYTKMTLFEGTINNSLLTSCRAAKIESGKTYNQASIECLIEQELTMSEVISEPYCRIKCDQPSILITGSYTGYDCDGYYYGPLIISSVSTPSIFIPQIRILGEVLHNGFDFTETIQNGIKTNIQTKKRYQVMGHEKMPPYVVYHLARIFGSLNVNIDGVDYNGLTKFDKNFDEGKSWILNTSVYTECDQIDTACE